MLWLYWEDSNYDEPRHSNKHDNSIHRPVGNIVYSMGCNLWRCKVSCTGNDEQAVSDLIDAGLEKQRQEYESETCPNCNGSGEGMHDGTKCNMCKGSGVA